VGRILPTKIDLRFALIHVELVSRERMREEAECEDDEPTPEGLWDVDTDTVFVGKWLRSKRKREVMMHELAHACLDWRDEGKCKS
jgi:Zn-dependent peptidase ImmA (M78 family)